MEDMVNDDLNDAGEKSESESKHGGEETVSRIGRTPSEASLYTTEGEEDDEDVESKLELGPQRTLKEQLEKDKVFVKFFACGCLEILSWFIF